MSSGWRDKGQTDGFILYKTKDEKEVDEKRQNSIHVTCYVCLYNVFYFLLFPIINLNSSSLLNISSVTVTADSFMIR